MGSTLTDEDGLTLIEMLVIFAILGILASVAASNLGWFSGRTQTAGAVAELESVWTEAAAAASASGSTPAGVIDGLERRQQASQWDYSYDQAQRTVTLTGSADVCARLVLARSSDADPVVGPCDTLMVDAIGRLGPYGLWSLETSEHASLVPGVHGPDLELSGGVSLGHSTAHAHSERDDAARFAAGEARMSDQDGATSNERGYTLLIWASAPTPPTPGTTMLRVADSSGSRLRMDAVPSSGGWSPSCVAGASAAPVAADSATSATVVPSNVWTLVGCRVNSDGSVSTIVDGSEGARTPPARDVLASPGTGTVALVGDGPGWPWLGATPALFARPITDGTLEALARASTLPGPASLTVD